MAIEYNRQYVGARYVPKFFENPDGSWDWAAGFQYEPLTIVKYGENAYTSKKLVPATVGSPNLNLDYWANTGNYNGAILKLQNDISGINTAITEINSFNKNKQMNHIIMITDSYGLGVMDGGGTTKSFVQYCIESLPNISIEFSGISGGGFTTSPTNFLSSLQAYADDPTVTDIMVIGGYNDNTSNLSNLSLAIENFMNYAHSHFINARIHLGVIGFDATQDTVANGIDNVVIPCYANSFGNYHYIQNCSCIMRDTTLLSSVHPTPEGQLALAKFFINYIGSLSDNWISNLLPLKMNLLDGTELGLNCYGRISNGWLEILTNNTAYLTINQDITLKGNSLFEVKIGTFPKGVLHYSNGSPWNMIPIYGQVNTGTKTSSFMGYLYSKNGDAMIKIINTELQEDTNISIMYLQLAGCSIKLTP